MGLIILLILAVPVGAIIYSINSAERDENAPEHIDPSLTGEAKFKALKQRAKDNAKTVSGGSFSTGKYWLSGKDDWLLLEKDGYWTMIPYGLISGYKPYEFKHGASHNGHRLGGAIAGGVIAGAPGAIIGALVSGGRQEEVMDSLGVYVFTSDGEKYDLSLINQPRKLEADDWIVKQYVKTLKKLDEIVD